VPLMHAARAELAVLLELTANTDPYERVYAYGSYHGSMAAKLLAAHRPFPGTCSSRSVSGACGIERCSPRPCPSLPNLRRRFPSLVRLVHRYYGTARLLQRVHGRRAACGLRGPALIIRPRRAGDLPVLVHVVSQRVRVLRLSRTGQPLANNVAAVLPSSHSEWSRHPDLRAFRSSIASPTDASVYASSDTSRCPLQDSRSGWIRYFLSCRLLHPLQHAGLAPRSPSGPSLAPYGFVTPSAALPQADLLLPIS